MTRTSVSKWVDLAPADLDGFRSSLISAGGVPTRFYDVGDGEPIVMIHGLGWRGESSGNTFVPVFPHLADEYRLIVPDKIASGLTGNPSSASEYTTQTQVKHMLAFVDELGLDRFHIVGQSRGGYLAARLAVENPDRIKSMVIVNSATIGPEVGNLDERRKDLFRGGAGIDSATPDDPQALRAALRFQTERLSYSSDHITDAFLDAKLYMESTEKSRASVAMLANGGMQTFLSSLQVEKPDTLRRLEAGDVPAPSLVFWGADDPSAILPVGLELFHCMRGGNDSVRMQIVNRAGHFHYREHPEEFSRTLKSFYQYWTL